MFTRKGTIYYREIKSINTNCVENSMKEVQTCLQVTNLLSRFNIYNYFTWIFLKVFCLPKKSIDALWYTQCTLKEAMWTMKSNPLVITSSLCKVEEKKKLEMVNF